MYSIDRYAWVYTGTEVIGAGIDEVDEAGAAVEFSEEDGGVGLGFGRFNPMKAGSQGAVLTAAFAEDSAAIAAHSHVSSQREK